jgi:hypothetical protein
MQIVFVFSTGSSAPAFPSEQYTEDEISKEKKKEWISTVGNLSISSSTSL